MRFQNKVVLVTGGGSGIGRAIALAFAGEGGSIVIAGRTAESLRETVLLIEKAGGTAAAVAADVTSSIDVAHLVEQTVQRFGGLDVAVNNVGMLGQAAPLADLDENHWRAVVDTNLTGTWLSMKYEIAYMRAHGGGAIVNVSSNLGAHRRLSRLGGYVATKAAVSALTRNAALDHIEDGVRINAVSPGAVDTTMSLLPGETAADRGVRMKSQIPLGRVASTAEVAAAVLYLASDEAGCTVGADLVVDGGASA